MSIAETISKKLHANLAIETLDIINNSHEHAGHSGWNSSGETHFTINISSNDFNDKTKIKRHQIIYQILQEEMRNKIHALSINATTPKENST